MRDTDAMTITIIMVCATLAASLWITRNTDSSTVNSVSNIMSFRTSGNGSYTPVGPNNTASNKSKYAPSRYNPCFIANLGQTVVQGVAPIPWYPNFAIWNDGQKGASAFCAQTTWSQGSSSMPQASNMPDTFACQFPQSCPPQWSYNNWLGLCHVRRLIMASLNQIYNHPGLGLEACDNAQDKPWLSGGFNPVSGPGEVFRQIYSVYPCGSDLSTFTDDEPYYGGFPGWVLDPATPNGNSTVSAVMMNWFQNQLNQQSYTTLAQSYHYIDCQVPNIFAYNNDSVTLSPVQMCGNYVGCLTGCANYYNIDPTKWPEAVIAKCGPECCYQIPIPGVKKWVQGYPVQVTCQLNYIFGQNSGYNQASVPCVGQPFLTPTPLPPPNPTPATFRNYAPPPPVPTFQRIQAMVMHHWVPGAFRVGLP